MKLKDKIAGFSFNKHCSNEQTRMDMSKLLSKMKGVKHVDDIDFDSTFSTERTEDFWYRGGVANVLIGDLNYLVSAFGDQRYYLFIKDWTKFDKKYHAVLDSELYQEYKTRHDSGYPIIEYVNKGDDSYTFYDVFKHLFKTNGEVKALTQGDQAMFELVCDNNNWLEIEVVDEAKNVHYVLTDIMCGIDVGCDVVQEVERVINHHKSFAEYLTNLP